jgi:hypothetical protein
VQLACRTRQTRLDCCAAAVPAPAAAVQRLQCAVFAPQALLDCESPGPGCCMAASPALPCTVPQLVPACCCACASAPHLSGALLQVTGETLSM